jgi:ATP-dependent DNA helicase PIF1
MYAKLVETEEKYELKTVNNLRMFNETSLPIPLDIMTKCVELKDEEVEQQMKLFCENSNLTQTLSLKKGAIVMCLANLDTDAGICNGSQGIVVDFVSNTQNMKCPVVKFLNGVVMMIQPRVYQHGDYPKFGVVQLPLRLAWAFTIHKSQGVTLDIAEIDIGSSIFEFGQTYVALSRIRSLNGLYLSSFNPRKIKTNPTVSAFYKTIPEITEEIAQKTKETLDIFEGASTVGASSTASTLSKPQGGGGLKVVLL